MKNALFYLLFLLPIALVAQFPTALGTKWEYYQFFQDEFGPSSEMPSFEDLVVGDTLAGGYTYQVVRRTGALYHGDGIFGAYDYDTIDGTYYYRVQGTQVLVLESVVQGMAQEKLLYEFGLSLGDTLQGSVMNLINTTGNYSASPYPVAYNLDSICANLGPCDTVFVYDSTDALPPYYPISYTFNSYRTNYFLPSIGTVYSAPYIIALDVYGQHYFLKQLTSQSQVLYFNPGLANAVGAASPGPSLRVSPNPATDLVRVNSAFPLQEIRLLDGLGQLVLSKRVDADALEAAFDVGDLPRGLYWLQANGETQIATQAVVVR